MAWELKTDRPIYIQLVEHIKLGIISGAYPPGERLPSVRDMAFDASVNPNTMQKALAELERDGLVFSQRTSGRFITEDKDMIDKVRNSLALEQITEFLKKMEKLGYNKSEIIKLMEREVKELN
ncbi:MAG: GntR family transcriptional regulator [Clostridiales bacterium]|nr:GntR family transcriptional regulator [Clostridiales bacterium]